MSGFSSPGGGVPAGTICDFGGGTVPPGYLACDGANVSRNVYARLFAAIGTVHGAGDGATTFALPDARRKVMVGSGGTGTATLGNAVGNTGGAETHALVDAENGPHAHGVPAQTGDPDTGGTLLEYSGSYTTRSTLGTHAAGSGSPHNNMQPSLVVTKMIKV